MTLDEAVAEFEKDFDVVEFNPDTSRPGFAVTGEPYHQVVCGGVMAEGECGGVWCATESMATRFWFQAARDYAAAVNVSQKARLYWRVRPEPGIREMPNPLAKHGVPAEKIYSVYSRFLVTSRPEMEPSKDAA